MEPKTTAVSSIRKVIILFVFCIFGAVLTYRVEVFTGHVSDAGTDASVHLMLVGERGDTGYRQLLKPLSTDLSQPFQRGQVIITLCELASVLYLFDLFVLSEYILS